MTRQKLRIGLLIDSETIPLWAFDMLNAIKASNHSEIVLIVKKKSEAKSKEAFFSSLWRKRKELVFLFYSKLEKKLFKSSPNPFESKHLKNLVSCPEIMVKPKETKFSDYILDDDIEAIKAFNVDVFIRLGFRILRGDILKISTYGVWSHHHGDNKVNRGGPPGVWEMFEKWKETGVVLQILTEDLDNGIKIYDSLYETDNLFVYRNKNDYYWKSRFMIPRKLEELSRLGEAKFFQKLKKWDTEPMFYYNKLYVAPTNWEAFKGIIKLYWSAFKRVIKRKFYFEQWILLFKLENTEKLSQSFYRFKRLLPPKDRFWADPFIIKKKDRYYIFIEELLYKENRGKISVIEMDEKGNHTKPKVVLETPYHLSYPFLIEDQGELYMLPETKENNTIELYKCIEFPHKWELEKVLFNNIKAVDSTIYKKEGKFWMFTNVEEYLGLSMTHELFLFSSESLLNDEWVPHPQNPLVHDHSKARPAGNIFTYKDRIFRPAQDCSVHYGYGMKINEILTLSESEYEEREVQSIHPNWDKDLLSTHTLNTCEKLTFIDAKISRKR